MATTIATNGTPHKTHPLGKRKRILAASLASTDNVDPLAIKRRKLAEANAAQSQPPPEPTVTDEGRDPTPDPFGSKASTKSDDEDNESQPDSDIEMYLPKKVAENDEDVLKPEPETDEDMLSESHIIYT